MAQGENKVIKIWKETELEEMLGQRCSGNVQVIRHQEVLELDLYSCMLSIGGFHGFLSIGHLTVEGKEKWPEWAYILPVMIMRPKPIKYHWFWFKRRHPREAILKRNNRSSGIDQL